MQDSITSLILLIILAIAAVSIVLWFIVEIFYDIRIMPLLGTMIANIFKGANFMIGSLLQKFFETYTT